MRTLVVNVGDHGKVSKNTRTKTPQYNQLLSIIKFDFPRSILKKPLILRKLQSLQNNFWLNFLFLMAAIFAVKGWPVPYSNEFVYLLFPVKQWHSDFLLNDWTFSEPDRPHLLFNCVVGFFTFLFSIETLGWIGRISCWSGAIMALFRLGKHFRIPLWMITSSIALVILQEPILIGEALFGPFEAKYIAYILLLFSISFFLEKRHVLASSLLGACFSFHPGVGLWAILAMGMTQIVLGYPIKKILHFAGYTSLFALPGVVALLPIAFGVGTDSLEEWKFLINIRFRFMDPASWVKRDLLLAFLLLGFNWLHFRKIRKNYELDELMFFQLSLSLIFVLGLALRLMGNYALLKYNPFRFFHSIVLLVFFFSVMNALHHSPRLEIRTSEILMALLLVMSLDNPLGQFADQVNTNHWKWTEPEDDFQRVCKWLGKHTPTGSIAILPPWRKEGWYLSKRAQIANWQFAPVGRLRQWRERIESMVGDDWNKNQIDSASAWREQLNNSYHNLTYQDIEDIVTKYGGDYFVSMGDYSYEMMFDSGTYKVYSLESHSAQPSLQSMSH